MIEDCNSAIELNNKYTKALFRRAKAYEQLNRLSESLEGKNKIDIPNGIFVYHWELQIQV